jgi:hypothetical protein
MSLRERNSRTRVPFLTYQCQPPGRIHEATDLEKQPHGRPGAADLSGCTGLTVRGLNPPCVRFLKELGLS